MSETKLGPGGIPDWLEPNVRFCSRCGTALKFGPIVGEERDRLACQACGFIFYVNPRLVVTTLPITERGEVMLIRRGIAPGYNKWAQPGGFLEIDETVLEAAIRETLEETGLKVEPAHIVGVYTRPQAAVVVLAWEARIVGGSAQPTPESLEVRAFAPSAIPWPQIAFQTSAWALRDWVRLRHPELDSPRSAHPTGWPADST